MKTYYKVACELYTEHVVPVLNAKQFDSGRGVDITLTDCGAVVVPAETDVCNLYCKKSDGTVSYIAGHLEGDAVRVDFTNVLLAEAGIVECELEVTSGTDTVSTPVFKMVVLPSNYDQSAIESTNEFTALEEALAQISNIGPAAYYDVANNLTTATAGTHVLDAAQGKALNDVLSGKLTANMVTIQSDHSIYEYVRTMGGNTYAFINAQNATDNPNSGRVCYCIAYSAGNNGAYAVLAAFSGDKTYVSNQLSPSLISITWTEFVNTSAKYQGTNVNGITWYAARFGKVFTLTAVNGTTTNAVNANAALITLSGFPNVFTNDDTVLSPCDTVDTISGVRLKVNNNSKMVYSSANVPAGTTIRAQIIGIIA